MNQEPYTPLENTAMLFAARYCYTRNTASALKFVSYLIANWECIDKCTQKQILREAYNEAQYNRDDWQKLFDHANYKPTEQ